jgi:4-hydroxybenzoyl-CoA reductase subunit beta
MHLEPFELHQPTTLAEALALAESHAGDFDYLAGGTDLLPNYKMRLNPRGHLIALGGIPELRDFAPSTGTFGALATLRQLETAPEVARDYPGLFQAVHQVATPLVRASGTIGGNLLVETRCFFFNQSLSWREALGYCLKAQGDRCHVVPQKERCYATFSGDLAPSLMVLGAEVDLVSPSGARALPLKELYDEGGDGIDRTTLRAGEVVVRVRLPREVRGWPSTYRKLRVRPAFDFPELGVAAALAMDGPRIGSLRLAVGGLETHPRSFDPLTDPLEGERLTDERIADLARRVQASVRPVHNTFLAPDYRRRMTEVFVRRALTDLKGAS